MNDMPATVAQVWVIWMVLIFTFSVFAFISKESKTGSFTDNLGISVFQGFLFGTVVAIPIMYCMLVLNINPFI